MNAAATLSLSLILLILGQAAPARTNSLNAIGSWPRAEECLHPAAHVPKAPQVVPKTTTPKTLCEPANVNVLFVIFPYKYQGVWVFDDDRVGLVREPFVSGADDILDALTANLPEADKGVKVVFSAAPFPGYAVRFIRDRSEYGGTWYRWPEKGKEGWLCPALFKYFEIAPKELFVRVTSKSQ